MNFQSLYERVAEKENITKIKAERLIQSVIEEIKTELSKPNRTVKIKEFGTFRSIVKRARKGRNPQTGKLIEIPKKQTVSFKPSDALKHQL